MPPLEDELRSALQGRAATLVPPADPFPGVERRARGMRRRRAAASVAGTALAVLAVAGAVPLLTPDRTAAPSPGEVATSAPSPTPPPGSYPGLLDPAAPWAYRGTLPVEGERAALTEAWTARHPGTTSVVPLFGQVHEPSGRAEVVVLARAPQVDRWGVLRSSEAGWEVAVEQDLLDRPAALVAALPGDEVARLLVVAAPQVEGLAYREAQTARATEPLARLAAGVGTGPLAGDRPDDVVQGSIGQSSFGALVPDLAADGQPASAPANVVDWPVRGPLVDPEVLATANRLYASGREVPASAVLQKVLVSGVDEDRPFLLGQFWTEGDREADTFAVVVRGGDDVEPQLLRPLGADADLVVLALTTDGGEQGARLVVVTRPDAVTLDYRETPDRGLVRRDVRDPQAVSLFDRPLSAERPDAPGDTLTVSFADGTERRRTVFELLCGKTSCG